MDNEDRIADPRLQLIMEQAPPTHVGLYLRKFLGVEDPGPFRRAGTVADFCAKTGVPQEEITAVLEERELVTPALARRLQEYMGMEDPEFFTRLQQHAYLDRLPKH